VKNGSWEEITETSTLERGKEHLEKCGDRESRECITISGVVVTTT
jgi:hypothetical protein